MLASLSAKKNMPDKAIGHLQTALALLPDDPDVLQNAADVYETLGNRTKALKYTHKALAKGATVAKLKNDHDLQGLLADPGFRNPSK